jgi:hypothetical protein
VTKLFADVEGAVRAWARARPLIVAQVGTRSFFGFPDGGELPLLTLKRAGGAPAGDVPLDFPRISFECWGRTKAEAAAVASAVKAEAESMTAGTQMAPGVLGYGASVELDLWAPDKTSGRARYVVDVVFTMKAAPGEAA